MQCVGGYILRVHRVSVAQEARVTEAGTNDDTYLPLPSVQGAAVEGRRSGGADGERGRDGDGECVCLSKL